jgi:hypothetical protein
MGSLRQKTSRLSPGSRPPVPPGSKTLFETGDPFLLFPAATLGHHALEMYLKAAPISNGRTVFNPNELKNWMLE